MRVKRVEIVGMDEYEVQLTDENGDTVTTVICGGKARAFRIGDGLLMHKLSPDAAAEIEEEFARWKVARY